MIESRCGILCSECHYGEQVGCNGCVRIDKPFWGDVCPIKNCCEGRGENHCGGCSDFPCKQLNDFAYDKKQGCNGKRIEQCKRWTLIVIVTKFAESGWDVIDAPSKAWLTMKDENSTNVLINAVKAADVQCGDCGCEFDGLYKRALELLTQTKKVSELNIDEKARLYPIRLSEYNPRWAEWFADEKALIEKLIGCENIVSIQHIGSTSVTGLIAKPTIDILLEIAPETDLIKLKASFPHSEYICLDRQTISTNDIMLFMKGYTAYGFANKVYHIHVRYEGDWDEVYFRDFLIANSKVATEYAALKMNLKDKFEFDRDGYTRAKGKFITEATTNARKKV